MRGTLYGTTYHGGGTSCTYGNYGCGTIFSVALSGGKETVLHTFGSRSGDGAYPLGGLINVNGTLYGTTGAGGANNAGTVFSITPSGTETVLYSFKGGSGDGAGPEGRLLDVRGTLYGITTSGGEYIDWGTFFSITTSGTETMLYSFGNPR
jgi:uncharacterized repeat protein (TIGR03803 family)